MLLGEDLYLGVKRMGLLGLVGHLVVVYRVLLRPVGFLSAVIPAMVVDFSPGSMRLFAWDTCGVCGPILGIHSIETSDHSG